MKSKLLALALFAGSSMFGAVRVGVEFGTPPPHPRAVWVAPSYRGHRYYQGYWR